MRYSEGNDGLNKTLLSVMNSAICVDRDSSYSSRDPESLEW